MSTVSVTNTFVNAQVADADEVNTNFSDLVTFLNGSVIHADNSKTLTAGTAAGSAARIDDTDIYVVFAKSGEQAITTGTHRFYVQKTHKILEVEASVGVAPTGASVIVDVNKNGTTIFTTQSNRPTIAASGFVDTADAIEVSALADGDYLTVDIDQVGSTLPGEDLTVVIRLRRV